MPGCDRQAKSPELYLRHRRQGAGSLVFVSRRPPPRSTTAQRLVVPSARERRSISSPESTQGKVRRSLPSLRKYRTPQRPFASSTLRDENQRPLGWGKKPKEGDGLPVRRPDRTEVLRRIGC